jgi:hypothetical protein
MQRLNFEKLYETVIEVVDPRAARVVARRKFPGLLIAALPGVRAINYTVAASGAVKLQIMTLKLNRP